MSPRTRRRSVLAVFAIFLALIGASCTKNGEAFTAARLINDERNVRGVSSLQFDTRLVDKAQAWADTMAARGSVSHSVLANGVGGGWSRLAENVGFAYSVEQAHALFMNSGSHRASMLNGGYTKFGTGVAISGNKYYVVQVFGA